MNEDGVLSITEQPIEHVVRKYSVDQNYSAYSHEDHETWRIATSALERVLVGQTAVDYTVAFESTGMSKNFVPSLERINEALEQFGWKAIVVDGFIPPDVFMLLQAHSILPISREIRARNQLGYTPIPDILHEAAGHLPMLKVEGYRLFLQRLGEIGAKTVLTPVDMAVYESGKNLAELLAMEDSDQDVIEQARFAVREAVADSRKQETSPARRLARFHWWTVEYGLVGPEHRIYGAGLLSSASEAHSYAEVPHHTLSMECCERSFDIDHAQPCYFVADSWDHLQAELDNLEQMVAA